MAGSDLQRSADKVIALVEQERRVLAAIAAGRSIHAVLEDLLRAVEAEDPAMLTSVLLLSDDGEHLRHGAAPSLPDDYNAAIDGIAIGEGIGSCGTAAARGSAVHVVDIEQDPLWENFRDLAAQAGVRACWSTPIRAADGRLLGTFAIYFREPREAKEEEHALISGITQTVALALERHLSDRRLRDSQDKLRRLNATLERRVAERTAKLLAAEEALFQAQKMEALGQITGGVAHDFNNVLMAVQTSLDLVDKRLAAPDAQVMSLLDNAREGVRRGTALTQRMLAFARKQQLAREAVDVAAMLEDMSDLLHSSLGHEIRLELDLPSALPCALGDRIQLEMAILNIAVNARDAMEGGGRLTIRAEEVAAERAFIALSLTDTGAGMDEATIARATEPFFTTKGPGLGTGLGLSMVEGLVEQLGGRLELDSAPGKGTTVRLLLPIAQGAVAPARDTTRQREPEVPGFASRRVLAVDDDALVLMGTEGMLEDLGLEVTVASSATEALALLAKTEFDLLLTDQAMPGMTGTELAERVRADHPDLPIILNTGYAEDPQAPLPQVDYRLGKPFTEAQLATAIESVLPAR